MANLDLGNMLGVVDTRGIGGTTTTPIAVANYDDVNSLRARLKVIDAGLYTDKYLDSLTHNDMVYAVRLNDDAAGL